MSFLSTIWSEERLLGAVLIALGAVGLYLVRMRVGLLGTDPTILPMAAAIGVGVIGIVIFARGNGAEAPPARTGRAPLGLLLAIGTIVAVHTLLFLPLGFLIAGITLQVCLFYLLGIRKHILILVVSGANSAILYYIISGFFRVPLPSGAFL